MTTEDIRSEVDQLVDKLAKPTFVLRMARPLENKNKSAKTRAHNARKEIEDIIYNYMGVR